MIEFIVRLSPVILLGLEVLLLALPSIAGRLRRRNRRATLPRA